MKYDDFTNIYQCEYIRELARDDFKSEKAAKKRAREFYTKLGESLLLLIILFIFYNVLKPYIG